MESELYIAIVDDDEDDIELLSEAFNMLKPGHLPVRIFHTGNEVLSYVRNAHHYPCLFVVDVNMHQMNGMELLAALRGIPHIKHVPVVVYSTSVSLKEKATCDDLGVQMFKKPSTFDGWQQIAGAMARLCEGVISA